MNIYVIDTCRVDAWRTAFSQSPPIFVHELADDIALAADDMVFAHTHEDLRGVDAPDLPLEDWNLAYRFSESIQRFLRCIQNARIQPAVILYSGVPIRSASAREWERRAVAAGGPLEGVPSQRVRCLDTAIARGIDADELRSIVGRAIGAYGAGDDGSEPGLSEKPSGTIAEQMFRAENHKLALRLLCDAWLHCRGQQQVSEGSFTITSPNTPADWFSPFGSIPSAVSARQIVSTLSVPAPAAESLLTKIAAGLNLGDPASAEALVTACRDALSTSPTTQEANEVLNG